MTARVIEIINGGLKFSSAARSNVHGWSYPYKTVTFMHNCLSIPEITSTIFGYLLYEYDAREYKQILQRRHLLALLKTCRTFYHPALALLWSVLYSPAPLLLTMPEDLVELGTGTPPLTIRFKRHVVHSDWNRFDFHALFVKELAEGFEEHDRAFTGYFLLFTEVCNELRRRDSVLLPNLKTLKATSGNGFAYAPAFLKPPLQHLHLYVHSNHILSLIQFLIYLPRDAPFLKSLHMQQSRTPWHDDSIRLINDNIHTTLLRDLNLEEFVCSWLPLTDDTTQHLLSMPALRSMTIRKDAPTLVRILHSQPMHTPQITTLNIHCDVMNDGQNSLASVLALFLPSKLTTFRVTSKTTVYGTSELSELLRAVGTHCSPKLLTEIILNRSEIEHDPVGDKAIVDLQMIQPLLPFSNLRKVCLPNQPFSLTDAEVKTLAMSWPHIEDFCFDNEGPAILEPRTTLRGMLWFAIYCRELQSLTFNFTDTAGNKVVLSQEEIDRAAGHRLRFLTVGHSLIDDPRTVSSFLNRVFSKLSVLEYTYGNDINGERWSEVQAQLH
ncbi:LOW QUALITY PROTEIN: hypothetical protein CVT25_014246 [Psilocybe cyanescens]|uniref:F-box domain-containing protein n=1 Tax=Psilocybe cyanescens TaxID=93625 RepID=A0A409VPA9_PSICY|nr:LOW QUALITY PROTEIN: hypothetical protein CVT25_014246 [Psilocybe cyanescens]